MWITPWSMRALGAWRVRARSCEQPSGTKPPPSPSLPWDVTNSMSGRFAVTRLCLFQWDKQCPSQASQSCYFIQTVSFMWHRCPSTMLLLSSEGTWFDHSNLCRFLAIAFFSFRSLFHQPEPFFPKQNTHSSEGGKKSLPDFKLHLFQFANQDWFGSVNVT